MDGQTYTHTHNLERKSPLVILMRSNNLVIRLPPNSVRLEVLPVANLKHL